MYCRKCGKEIPDDSTFCSHCGTNTKGEIKPAAKKKDISLVTVVLLVLLIAAVAVIAVLALKPDTVPAQEEIPASVEIVPAVAELTTPEPTPEPTPQPTLYSYFYYKKQLAAGTATADDASFIPRGLSKKGRYISLALLALVLMGMALLLFTGSIEYSFGEDSFTVEASYWADLTVKYEAVESVEYLESHSSGLRQNGFCSARLGMGIFKSDALGSYTRYCYTKCPAAVVLTVEGKTLVLNAADEAGTLALYQQLMEKCG